MHADGKCAGTRRAERFRLGHLPGMQAATVGLGQQRWTLESPDGYATSLPRLHISTAIMHVTSTERTRNTEEKI